MIVKESYRLKRKMAKILSVFDQAFRAELFLGYMARPVSEKDQDDGSSEQQEEVRDVE